MSERRPRLTQDVRVTTVIPIGSPAAEQADYDQEAIDWLAEQTGQSRDAIEEGFEKGRLRRRAVVTELVEAGIVGRELLGLVVRLAGLPPDEARQLIAVEAPEALEEPAAGDQARSVMEDRRG